MRYTRVPSHRANIQRQDGFIHNLIIPGIVLIGIVLAGIAMLANNSTGNTDNEKASMLANVVLKQGVDYSTAIQRAEGDGAILATFTGKQALTSLTSGGYIGPTMPALPSDLVNGTAWAYDKGEIALEANGSVIGTGKNDVLYAFLGADSLAHSVCLRINNKLYGLPTTPQATGADVNVTGGTESIVAAGGAGTIDGTLSTRTDATEGCVYTATNPATGYTYYKLVSAR